MCFCVKVAHAAAQTVRFRMREGDLISFDNRRVLHARDAYSEATSGTHASCFVCCCRAAFLGGLSVVSAVRLVCVLLFVIRRPAASAGHVCRLRRVYVATRGARTHIGAPGCQIASDAEPRSLA